MGGVSSREAMRELLLLDEPHLLTVLADDVALSLGALNRRRCDALQPRGWMRNINDSSRRSVARRPSRRWGDANAEDLTAAGQSLTCWPRNCIFYPPIPRRYCLSAAVPTGCAIEPLCRPAVLAIS
jgi:hypothetical protein